MEKKRAKRCKGVTYTQNEEKALNNELPSEFVETVVSLKSDNKLIKALISEGATIEPRTKRIKVKYRNLYDDAPRRDLIFMSLPKSLISPSVEGLKFGYMLYVHASIKEPSRIKTTVNITAIDECTGAFLMFGPEYEVIAKMEHLKWDIDEKVNTVDSLMEQISEKLTKLDRFIQTLDSDTTSDNGTFNVFVKRNKKEDIDNVSVLNRELIGAMLRTARRTTEVVNIEDYKNREALSIRPKCQKCSWSKGKETKLKLWRIAFNNVFDTELLNGLQLTYRVAGRTAVMTNKEKSVDYISAQHLIPIYELITRALMTTLVTVENYEEGIVDDFDIKNFLSI